MYKTLHKKQGSVTVQLRFARSSVTFCAKRDINHQNLVDKKQNTHTWVSMRDERVRVSHWEADGQTVPINEPFIINGYKMMFPLDDSMGAPIDEIINCRCVEL